MAKVTGIGVEFGVSISTGDKSWIKATAKMDVEFEAADHAEGKTDENFEMAWARVTHEVNKQIQNFGVQVVNNSTGQPVK